MGDQRVGERPIQPVERRDTSSEAALSSPGAAAPGLGADLGPALDRVDDFERVRNRAAYVAEVATGSVGVEGAEQRAVVAPRSSVYRAAHQSPSRSWSRMPRPPSPETKTKHLPFSITRMLDPEATLRDLKSSIRWVREYECSCAVATMAPPLRHAS